MGQRAGLAHDLPQSHGGAVGPRGRCTAARRHRLGRARAPRRPAAHERRDRHAPGRRHHRVPAGIPAATRRRALGLDRGPHLDHTAPRRQHGHHEWHPARHHGAERGATGAARTERPAGAGRGPGRPGQLALRHGRWARLVVRADVSQHRARPGAGPAAHAGGLPRLPAPGGPRQGPRLHALFGWRRGRGARRVPPPPGSGRGALVPRQRGAPPRT